MEWLVKLVCPAGGTVLDCFLGSGSTLVAAVGCGRHGIGIEENAEYLEIARRRIADAQALAAGAAGPLFAEPASTTTLTAAFGGAGDDTLTAGTGTDVTL